MSNPSVIIPPDVNEVIEARATVWQTIDAAQMNAGKLEDIAKKVRSSGVAPPIAPLIDENDPHQELTTAIWQLQEQLQKIDRTAAEIREHESEIEQVGSRKKTAIIWTCVLVVALIIILFMVLS